MTPSSAFAALLLLWACTAEPLGYLSSSQPGAVAAAKDAHVAEYYQSLHHQQQQQQQAQAQPSADSGANGSSQNGPGAVVGSPQQASEQAAATSASSSSAQQDQQSGPQFAPVAAVLHNKYALAELPLQFISGGRSIVGKTSCGDKGAYAAALFGGEKSAYAAPPPAAFFGKTFASPFYAAYQPFSPFFGYYPAQQAPPSAAPPSYNAQYSPSSYSAVSQPAPGVIYHPYVAPAAANAPPSQSSSYGSYNPSAYQQGGGVAAGSYTPAPAPATSYGSYIPNSVYQGVHALQTFPSQVYQHFQPALQQTFGAQGYNQGYPAQASADGPVAQQQQQNQKQ